jgi:hypothetical protein
VCCNGDILFRGAIDRPRQVHTGPAILCPERPPKGSQITLTGKSKGDLVIARQHFVFLSYPPSHQGNGARSQSTSITQVVQDAFGSCPRFGALGRPLFGIAALGAFGTDSVCYFEERTSVSPTLGRSGGRATSNPAQSSLGPRSATPMANDQNPTCSPLMDVRWRSGILNACSPSKARQRERGQYQKARRHSDEKTTLYTVHGTSPNITQPVSGLR